MLIVVTLLSITAVGKRMPPRPVPPVINNGVRYSADGDGRNGYVVAEEVATNKELWKVLIFHQRIKFWVEEDVQWIYITNLKLDGRKLLIRDEKARCYNLDMMTKHVHHQNCDDLFPEVRHQ